MTADDHLREESRRAAYWTRRYASERGLSLDKLAAFSDVARNSIIEMERRAPTLRTLSSVAHYLGIKVRDLLQDIPEDD